MSKAFTKLTRPQMRKLKPGGLIVENGIEFERLANGDGVFTVNIMVDGERVHRVIGRESDGTTRTQAESFIERTRTAARDGRLNLPQGRKIALGFQEAAEKYLEKLAEEGGKDLVMKRRRLTLHLVPFFGDSSISNINSFDIERYKKSRREEKAKEGTVNRELAALSHLLSKAVEWKWLQHRPTKIVRYKEGNGRIIYLTVPQIDRVLEAAKQDQNPHFYAFITIALEPAMRTMEDLSTWREHVDVERRTIYIPHAKAGAREQPMTAELAEFLDEYMKALPPGTEWLFPSEGSRTGHTVDIAKSFRRVVKNAGLNPSEVVRHTLRHTAITHLVQAGVDLPTVKRISGHKTLMMVERYAHQNGPHIQTAMDKLSKGYRSSA